MQTKLERMINMAHDATLAVTSSPDRWKAFLDSAAWLYKYPFQEQVLIHAQKPEATACAELSIWNERLHRWVNRGAKGIALIDASGEKLHLRYVFDVSDTNSHQNIPLKLWQPTPEMHSRIAEELQNNFGDLGGLADLAATVFGTSLNAVTDNHRDYLEALQSEIENSALAKEENLNATFQMQLASSVSYVVLKRLGFDPDVFLTESDFESIAKFDTLETISRLGEATSDISEMILRQIERSVRQIEKEDRDILAKEKEIGDNADENKGERSNDHGTDLHASRERTDSEPDTGRTAGGLDRQVRTDAQTVSGGEEGRHADGAGAVRETDAAPHVDQRAGDYGDRRAVGEDGKSRRIDRTVEIDRSHALDTADEQYSQQSRGDRTERSDLQLIEDEPKISEVIDLDEEAVEEAFPASLFDSPQQEQQFKRDVKRAKPAAPQMSLFDLQEITAETAPEETVRSPTLSLRYSQQVIDEALTLGASDKNSRLIICAYFQKDHTPEENAAFLREHYGANGAGFYLNDRQYAVWYDQSGFRISAGDSVQGGMTMTLSWEEAAKRIRELLDLGRYMPQSELLRVNVYERSELAQQLLYVARDLSEEGRAQGFLPTFEALSGAFDDQRDQLMTKMEHPESLQALIDEWRNFAEAHAENPNLLRFRFYRPMQLLHRLKDLQREPLHFTVAEDYNPQRKQFISLDEIDRILRENDSEHGTEQRLGIYAFFLAHGESKDREKYLKSLHGEYSGSFGGNDSKEYTAKGLKFSHGSMAEPYAKIEWNWTKVRKRIETLIAQNRFLLDADLAYMPEYERKQVARSVVNGYMDAPLEYERPYSKNAIADYWECVEEVQQQLTDPARVQSMYTALSNLEAHTLTTERRHDLRHRAVQDLSAYRDGEFSLFGEKLEPIPEPVAESEAEKAIWMADENVSTEPDEISQPEPDEMPQPESMEQPTADESEQVKLQSTVIDLRPSWEREQPQPEATPTVSTPFGADKINFRITDDHLGEGGAKTKFQRNIAAIRTLKAIESEYRLATSEEQQVLSEYVGWGGLPDAFDPTKDQWQEEYAELKELLTPEEYASARASTLNAHYTSPIVIRAMYDALGNMGFQTGNILEPSCGIGNFFGMLPESMSGSRLYGVELDDLTGRIAKQLYQNADIRIDGFESTAFPDSFFDVAIGNVPFGDYSLADKRYDKNHFLVHDYFFAKALDKVRPGGVVAFITSSGTMDKANPSVRKYLAQRAELLGAIRLPNNAFRANAGTDVVVDILFLQKRDHPIEIDEDWLHIGKSDLGYPINEYFLKNPDMVLGELTEESTRFGMGQTVKPIEGADLSEQLLDAIANIHGEIAAPEQEDELEGTRQSVIPADPTVRNFSYTTVNGELYYRENSGMTKIEVSLTAQNRIRGMIAIRDCVHKLIDQQLNDFPDAAIRATQKELNDLYDAYTAKYGLLNSRGNKLAFADDSSYPVLCALEVIDENGKLERKADMFFKRTVRQYTEITHVDTAAEALTVSLSEKATVDLPYMAWLTGKSADELETELSGLVFRDMGVMYAGFVPADTFALKAYPLVTADAFLSGDVRHKLRTYRDVQQKLLDAGKETEAEMLRMPIDALEKVQPKDLDASEISVRLGSTWIPEEDVKAFILETLQPGWRAQRYLKVHYFNLTGEWKIEGKNTDPYNVTATVTYGTKRINAYEIMEDTLNLKDVRIYDTVTDDDGKEKRVLNMQQTILAQQKQTLLQDAFREWLWRNPERRDRLVTMYNERFNSTRPREYEGSHLTFPGMNPEITLRPHQVNAIARILYGGNTLLAHVVGAGKTFEMTAAAMELKRLGLCHKSLFVVPNHLTEQWASEFLQLYPSANILVATKKDFEKQNRRKFCSRIATGDYDAVIIGHSQFEKIPLSMERQKQTIQEQIDEITAGIEALEAEAGNYLSIKQMEKTKRGLETKLQRLNDQTRKDDVVTFEELGVDRLFVDEAHYYKNLFLYTKMRNVAGISQTEAQKSSDLYMKCRYLDEITDSHGVVFATGTPISNSMTEMYTMQRYLQYNRLLEMHLQHFDAWASTFGETVTAIELAPEGTGYRAKTRFAKFFNLPELISMFKDIADVQTADMLKLPVPEVEYHNEALKPSEFQREMVSSFADRAEKVRKGFVKPYEDNMLKITNDGRKLALDQRLNNPLLPDDPSSKVNTCAENIYRIWHESKAQKSAQLVFCDLSTPHKDGNFNVYDDLRTKLIERGVPENEIAFVHDANTETRKADLFANVRSGKVRILLGSTAKMGAGTNVQQRLIALHHLDIPWRPADIAQREGRILRQGNDNPKVEIFRYVTENTFDSYMWQTIEAKQKFIGQIMTSKTPARACEDVDETALTYAEVKALATGNPHIKEKMDLEVQVSKLKLLKSNYLSMRYSLENKLLKEVPQNIRLTEENIAGCELDKALYEQHKVDGFAGMTVSGTHYGAEEKKEAGTAILAACMAKTSGKESLIGSYMGFDLYVSYDSLCEKFRMRMQGTLSHYFDLGNDVYGNITRMDNMLASLPNKKARYERELNEFRAQEQNLKEELDKPFSQEEELRQKTDRLTELDAMLNLDKHESEAIGEEDEDRAEEVPERSNDEYER